MGQQSQIHFGRLRRLGMALGLAALALGACLNFAIPDNAQIRCSEDDDRCPAGWLCCGGQCEQGHCTCEHGSCNTEFAVNCQTGRLCSGGCWQDCAACADNCSDRTLKNCSLDAVDGIWFCRKGETCLLREDGHGGQIADCLSPSPMCIGGLEANCDCLDSPSAFYPPCGPGEACAERSTQCVACVPEETGDRRVTDGGEPEPELTDAGISDVSLDGEVDGSLTGIDDAGTSGSGDVDQNPVNDFVAPDCFAGTGTSPLGQTCCDGTSVSASFSDDRWVCPEGYFFGPTCDGFGDSCIEDRDPACRNDNTCVWEFRGTDGVMTCSDFGPPSAPCVDHQWQCYCGTRLASTCPQ